MIGPAALAAVALAQTLYSDAGAPDPNFAPYGVEAYRAITDVCLPNTLGRLSLKPENAAALAAADVRPIDFPAEWKIRAVSLKGGKPDWAERPSTNGRIFLAALPPGRLCEVLVLDAPTRGRIFISLDAALRDAGWSLRNRADSLETTRRTYELHPRGAPHALLDVTEFVYGGGPVRHVRLRATLKSFDR